MIKVYSKPNCMQCKYTKIWLDEHNIEYVELDVEKNEEYLQEMKGLGFNSLPLIVIDGQEPFTGFKIDKLEALLNE